MSKFFARHSFFKCDSSGNGSFFAVTSKTMECTDINASTQFHAQRTFRNLTITITFEINGGSEIVPIQMISGNKIAKPTDPTKTDWYFGGWYSDSGLTQRWNFDTIVYDDMTLYAKWRDTDFPYDSEIEYLESSGTQYIKTGLTPFKCTDVEIIVNNLPNGVAWQDYFGGDFGDSGNNYRIRQYQSYQNKCDIRIGNSYYQFNITENAFNKIKIGRNGAYLNNDELPITPGNTYTNINDMYLFGYNLNSSIYRAAKVQIQKFTAFNNNSIVLELIPVRKDGVGYMYDKVSKQLFGNSGTGNFILGPDKNT